MVAVRKCIALFAVLTAVGIAGAVGAAPHSSLAAQATCNPAVIEASSRPLPTLGGDLTIGRDVDVEGRVGGGSRTRAGLHHAFLFDSQSPRPTMLDLDRGPEFGDEWATSVTVLGDRFVAGVADREGDRWGARFFVDLRERPLRMRGLPLLGVKEIMGRRAVGEYEGPTFYLFAGLVDLTADPVRLTDLLTAAGTPASEQSRVYDAAGGMAVGAADGQAFAIRLAGGRPTRVPLKGLVTPRADHSEATATDGRFVAGYRWLEGKSGTLRGWVIDTQARPPEARDLGEVNGSAFIPRGMQNRILLGYVVVDNAYERAAIYDLRHPHRSPLVMGRGASTIFENFGVYKDVVFGRAWSNNINYLAAYDLRACQPRVQILRRLGADNPYPTPEVAGRFLVFGSTLWELQVRR